MNSLDEIITDIKNNTKDYSRLELLRYIYLYLGKIFKFDTSYYFGNSKTKYKIYRNCIYSKEMFDKKIKEKNIICIWSSYIMKYICKEFGIHIDIKIEEDPETIRQHYYNLATIDNKKFIVDLQCDLDNIQTNCKTEHFGVNEKGNKIISEEKLKEIDLKIKYITEESTYTNDYLYMLMKAIDGNYSFEDKFDLVIKSLNMYTDISKLNYAERYMYYKKMIKILFNNQNKNIILIDSYKIIDEQRVGTLLIYVRVSGNYYKLYRFNEEKNNFEDLKYDELKQDIDKGLVLKKQIPIRKKLLNNFNI